MESCSKCCDGDRGDENEERNGYSKLDVTEMDIDAAKRKVYVWNELTLVMELPRCYSYSNHIFLFVCKTLFPLSIAILQVYRSETS